MGWDPPSKKQELFHPDSRFVLLRRLQAKDGLEHLHEELVPILAYSMFRFDMEVDECVLYWYGRLSMTSHSSWGTHLLYSYELQVSQSAQRGGMGKTLMGCLYDIARRWNIRKVMLTVFKGENVSVSLGPFPYSEVIRQKTMLRFHFTRPWGWCDFLIDMCKALILYVKIQY
jgi:GNAT superfamily N-acetyltransferase